MENYSFEEDNELKEQEEQVEEEADAPEEGFIKGYAEDEEVSECAECGGAVKEEKKLTKEFDSESFIFCCKDCAKDFEDERN